LESTLDSGDKLLTNNILIATGREPNLLPLNLDFLNLKMDGQFLDVDELNQTSNANIFAVGDIINKPNLTPVAIEQGRVFSDNFFNAQKRKVNYENIPKAVFTIPEISTVGLSEKKAIEEMARIKQSAISDESSEASRAISQLRKEAVELAIKKALDSLPNRLDTTTQENLVTQSINNIEVN